MTTKAKLEFGSFSLELEGGESFVAAQLAAFAPRIPGRIPQPEQPATSISGGDVEDDPPTNKEKKKPRKAANGPSCALRIIPFVGEGFFDSPRKSNEVSERLKEKATPYEGKHVAAALTNLTQRGSLRRVKQEGTWHYVKP